MAEDDMNLAFQPWPKIHRLYRDVLITEKIDGTNACVCVVPLDEVLDRSYERTETYRRPSDGTLVGGDESSHPGIVVGDHVVFAQSRKKVISPGADNYGFAWFVRDNARELAASLGEGRHFGEWYGKGIQSGYGATEKRFALFNVARWAEVAALGALPWGVTTVPLLYEGVFTDTCVQSALSSLTTTGSRAVGARRGFAAEGVVVYFKQANQSFKVLLEDDAVSKFEAANAALRNTPGDPVRYSQLLKATGL